MNRVEQHANPTQHYLFLVETEAINMSRGTNASSTYNFPEIRPSTVLPSFLPSSFSLSLSLSLFSSREKHSFCSPNPVEFFFVTKKASPEQLHNFNKTCTSFLPAALPKQVFGTVDFSSKFHISGQRVSGGKTRPQEAMKMVQNRKILSKCSRRSFRSGPCYIRRNSIENKKFKRARGREGG